ncbi:DUF3667 domain-containing protein [Rugamonas apoptosis]|uniref:DUF3667 domain-containing protein n=1 Tax=Rugamonas apoptosis TaxID=2758570 RepID=UPI001E2984B2|nr:DUF3667 domain-containing protein [Rugamonas apoptosis]
MKPELHAAHAHGHTAPSRCANCQATVSGNYCHQCGQETVLHPPSTREFLHEFIGHYVALEGKLWGTLGRLLFRPGALTNEYVRGRRVRFVQPLRLYLTLSVLFFALIKLVNPINLASSEAATSAAATPATHHVAQAQAQAHAAPAKPQRGEVVFFDDDGEGDLLVTGLKGFWPAGADKLKHQEQYLSGLTDAQRVDVFTAGFYHFAPYAMFLLLPLFALYLKLLYLGSGRRYGEHLLFALHVNAFAFFLFMCLMLPMPGVAQFALWIWLLGYLPWAMRRVYQGGKFATTWRWLALMAAYSVTMAIGFLFTVGAGVLTAGH